jgi:hypothetical protein
MGSLKKKENTRPEKLHDNEETDAATSTSSFKDKFQETLSIDRQLFLFHDTFHMCIS